MSTANRPKACARTTNTRTGSHVADNVLPTNTLLTCASTTESMPSHHEAKHDSTQPVLLPHCAVHAMESSSVLCVLQIWPTAQLPQGRSPFGLILASKTTLFSPNRCSGVGNERERGRGKVRRQRLFCQSTACCTDDSTLARWATDKKMQNNRAAGFRHLCSHEPRVWSSYGRSAFRRR